MFGYPSARHLLKVEPFLLRLQAASKGLYAALRSGNPLAVFRGVDDTSFWVGRSVAEMLSASEAGTENIPLFRQGLEILLQSQIAIGTAKEWIKRMGMEKPIDVSNPMDFVSPKGNITAPLMVKKSKIKDAGNGLHTMTSIPKGTVISPSRIKIKNNGNLFSDWRVLKTAPLVNHSPFPNMDVRRGAPLNIPEIHKLHPQARQGSYFVANRNIYPGEELSTDYRDKGWAEHDYYDELPLPLEKWDRNVYHSIGIK